MFSRAALQGRLYWLLDLHAGDEVIRLAETEMVVTVDKSVYRYHAGLEWAGDFPVPMSPFDAAPTEKSVSVILRAWPHLDVSLLVSRGLHPGTWTAELLLWSEEVQQTQTILQAMVRDPMWGAAEEPMICTLSEEPMEDIGEIIPRRHRVLAATLPNHDQAFNKEYYLTVFGSPCGDLAKLAPQNRHPHAGTPVLIMARVGGYAAQGLIAGHLTYAGAHGDMVTLTNYTQVDRQEVQAQHGVDAEGHPITWVQFSAAWSPAWLAGDDIWCAWRTDDNGLTVSTPTYGLMKEDSSGDPMLGVGDLICFLAKRSKGLRWNWARLDAMRPRLNQLRLDGYIMPDPNSPITPWEWLQQYVLRNLPLSAHLDDGLYFRWWDFTADAQDAVCELRADDGDGRNCGRYGSVETTPLDDVRTRISADYYVQHRDGAAKLNHSISGYAPDWSRSAQYQHGAFGTDSTVAAVPGKLVTITDGVAPEVYTLVAFGGPYGAAYVASELALEINWGTSTIFPGTGPSLLVRAEMTSTTEVALTAIDDGETPPLTITLTASWTTEAHDHIGDAAGVANAFIWDETDEMEPDPWLVLSYLLYGDRGTLGVQLDMVEDTATAARIVGAMAKRAGPQRMSIIYEVLQYPGGLLEPGSVVLVTDTELYLDRAVGLVMETTWTDKRSVMVRVEIPIHGFQQAV